MLQLFFFNAFFSQKLNQYLINRVSHSEFFVHVIRVVNVFIKKIVIVVNNHSCIQYFGFFILIDRIGGPF